MTVDVNVISNDILFLKSHLILSFILYVHCDF